MARLYANENFPAPVVAELRALGHDVLTIQETGKDQQAFPDDALLQFATENRRAVLTFNRKHFIALHRQSNGHEGIIACSFDINSVALAHRIHLEVTTEESLAGKLIRINRPQK